MGSNAGGYGSMTFASKAALASWKATAVSHAAYDDWLGLAGSHAPDETAETRMRRIAKAHDVSTHAIQEITVAGTTVSLVYDVHEEAFRDGAGDIAALVRAADRHDAKGTFFFLGTAGAEHDFAYRLTLTGRGSKLVRLTGAAETAAYGADYDAFQQRVSAMTEAQNAPLAAIMTKLRQGERAGAGGGELHARVWTALSELPAARLATLARAFPAMVPDGKRGQAPASRVFDEKTIVSALSAPPNEETRGVALWMLGQHASELGVSLAFEATAPGSTASAPLRGAALRVLSRATGPDADRALERLFATFEEEEPPMDVLFGAQAALFETKHAGLERRLEAALTRLAKPRTKELALITPAHSIIYVIEAHDLRTLAPALRAFVKAPKANANAKLSAQALLSKWRKR